MKYLKQFIIIILISFIGEILKYFIPLPIPSSIYGMIILFVGLVSGIIPYNSVKETGKFLIDIMPVMFIPAGVGLMASFGILKPLLVPVIVITILTNIAVMAVTGLVAQGVIRHKNKKGENKKDE